MNVNDLPVSFMTENEFLGIEEKKVTTKELAEALGVDISTIQKEVSSLGIKCERIGRSHTMVFTEAQATAINTSLQNKTKIAKNGFTSLTISNDLDMLLMQQKLNEYQSKRIAELQAENERQSKKLVEQAPKVEFYDCVTGSKDTVDMAQCAKVINLRGWGRNNIFQLLRNKGILDGKNQPYQQYCDRNYFRIIESKFVLPTGEIKISLKTVIYQKGLDFIRKLIEAEENEHVKPLSLRSE